MSRNVTEANYHRFPIRYDKQLSHPSFRGNILEIVSSFQSSHHLYKRTVPEGNAMTSNPSRVTFHPLSNPKAGPTTSTSRAAATSHASQQPSRSESLPHLRKTTSGSGQADAATDKSTIALIRRVLCPESSSYGSSSPRPLHELLPPLTSSNEVDLQLYALIAIIIKEFIYSWYAKITTDHVFVDELLQLIAHCTRALEERLRRVDVEQLVLDEIPCLVEAHIIAYRTAKQGSDLVPLPSSVRETYHTLNPHPALSPVPNPLDPKTSSEQHENEVAYRHLLAQGTLAILLPTEDLENVCLRTLVSDVLADLILGKEVSGKVCEGWFIWETVSKVISLVSRRGTDRVKREGEAESASPRPSQLERFGLVSTEEDQHQDDSSRSSQSQLALWMWKLLHAVYLIYVTLRFVVTGLFRAALSLPEVPARDLGSSPDHPTPISRSNEASSRPGKTATRRPVLEYRAFGMLSRLIDLPRRMPWLVGCVSLIQCLIVTGPARLGDTEGILDR
ncbi:PXA domain protein [Rasamsonia emersonii CBS 393.64]|uniref:PXA domain protein n=1 Tax=Rasamsonia emersonii (strain ATCC 16479 / CBS 393.64 / IMI 116815) TaxID=1408163 RepID=A0A0F4YEM8_RASE3|nr:PXA domain protein [Rasamsonia emersonii CBS 393.64]KKA16622.1 PXA domain protein [Rasamsonia emersonii CBS 393.64]